MRVPAKAVRCRALPIPTGKRVVFVGSTFCRILIRFALHFVLGPLILLAGGRKCPRRPIHVERPEVRWSCLGTLPPEREVCVRPSQKHAQAWNCHLVRIHTSGSHYNVLRRACASPSAAAGHVPADRDRCQECL